MTMSRDGQYVVLGTDGGRTELWRVHELEPVHAFPMCDAPIRSLCFTHDNKYDATSSRILYTVPTHHVACTLVQYSAFTTIDVRVFVNEGTCWPAWAQAACSSSTWSSVASTRSMCPHWSSSARCRVRAPRATRRCPPLLLLLPLPHL